MEAEEGEEDGITTRNLGIKVKERTSNPTTAVNIITILDQTSRVVTDIHSLLQLSHLTHVSLHRVHKITTTIPGRITDTTMDVGSKAIEGEEDTQTRTKDKSQSLVQALLH